MAAQETNLLGQKMGRKGRETRKKIMNVALRMLENSSYKDLTVTEVAYEADVSSSTFYVYFEDIEDVLYTCILDAALDFGAIVDLLNEDWDVNNVERKVAEFVEAYNKMWERHRIELRIRNIEANQGNLRFMNLVMETTADIQVALARKVSQVSPRIRNPQGVATVIFAAMDIIAASHQIGLGSATRLSRKHLNSGIVELLSNALKFQN